MRGVGGPGGGYGGNTDAPVMERGPPYIYTSLNLQIDKVRTPLLGIFDSLIAERKLPLESTLEIFGPTGATRHTFGSSSSELNSQQTAQQCAAVR